MDNTTITAFDVRLGGLAAALPPAERAVLAALLGLPSRDPHPGVRLDGARLSD
jgi:hypothetical protein